MANRHMKRCSTPLINKEMQIKTAVNITSHLSEWLSSKRTQITNVGKVWRKGNPHTLLVGMYISTATVENSMEVSQKMKNITTK